MVKENLPEIDFDITFIIEGLGSGGAQRVLVTICQLFVDSGYTVAVVTFQSEDKDFFVLPENVHRFVVPRASRTGIFSRGIIANILDALSLRRVMRNLRSDCFFSFICSTNILAICANYGLGKRLIISERNDPSKQELMWQWSYLRRKLYRNASVVTANTHTALQYMQEFVPADRLCYLPNPVIGRQSLSKRESSEKCEPYVLMVGRLHPQKSVETLLKAFGLCVRVLDDWRLRIIGTGSMDQELKLLAHELGVSERVDWIGEEFQTDQHYSNAKIFVLPSVYEGQPNAVLEAMSYGVPVIVSDGSAGPLEIVTDGVNGKVFPVRDYERLSEILIELGNNENLRHLLGEKGKERSNDFLPESVFMQWRNLLVSG